MFVLVCGNVFFYTFISKMNNKIYEMLFVSIEWNNNLVILFNFNLVLCPVNATKYLIKP